MRAVLLRVGQVAGVVGLVVGVAAAVSGAWDTAAFGLVSAGLAVVATVTAPRPAASQQSDQQKKEGSE